MQVTSQKPCIEATNLTFRYGKEEVLSDISFSISSGDYVGIIGPNGAGKTTLLKIILGLLKPTSGQVKIFGTSVAHLKDRSWIGYVPQHALQNESYFPASVEEVVRSGRTAKVGMWRGFHSVDRIAVKQALEITDVIPYQKKLIGELSGGELQRVFIARALAAEPRILILDEPATGIDLASQEKFYAFLRTLNLQHGMTIIFVSHDVDVVAHEAKTVLCLNQKLVCHAAPKDFLSEDFLEKLYGKKVKYILHDH